MECEAVSFGPLLLHLRSRGVEQWGTAGWIMNRSFLTMNVTAHTEQWYRVTFTLVLCDVGLVAMMTLWRGKKHSDITLMYSVKPSAQIPTKNVHTCTRKKKLILFCEIVVK